MTDKLTRLELTWPGKEDRFNPEPRILLEDKEKSYSKPVKQAELGATAVKPTYDNMLIHGDNLLALKALEQDYTGKVKCIYIDPPYNTGNAFEHYDDGLEHSIWLSLMRDRLEILKRLLAEDGSIWISIDYNEVAYLKVLCDEVFGRHNEISLITVKVKDPAGVGQQSVIFDVSEYIIAYAKDLNKFKEQQKELFDYTEIKEPIKGYNNYIKNYGTPKYIKTIERGGVGKIDIYACENAIIDSVRKLSFDDYLDNFSKIAADYNAGGGMIVAIKDEIPEKGLSYIEYTPLKGKNKGQKTKVYFKNQRILSYLTSITEVINGIPNRKTKMTNIWTMQNASLHLEGGVAFPNGKKAEHLIQKVIEISTNPGDLVLDSFLGSGTTAAVAQKMGRRWIGVEMGDHIYTHCIPRLRKVIDGEDQGGITKAVHWQGGGGFKFYELASSLIVKDKYGQQIISDKYNADMLAEAMCKILGYRYKPDAEKYWKQGYSSEKSFIYTTTMSMQEESLGKLAAEVGDDNLLICCSAFIGNKTAYPNITVKKIPAAILKKCEWGREGYPLNLHNYHPTDEDFEFEDSESEVE